MQKSIATVPQSGLRGRLPLSVILMLLLATQVVATDLYLPALPHIAADLAVSAGKVQSTLTVFVLSFGLAQLLAGPLVDRYGRRAILLWGLGLYVVATLGGAMASSLPLLLLFRALQGCATAAAVIGARAIIRDNHDGAAGMKSMAASLTGQSVIGVACPLVGGMTVQYVGWHATIGVEAGFGVLAWLAVYAGFAETYARPARGNGGASFACFFRDRQFVACSLLAGLSFSGALAFLLLSPFVFIGEFGMSKVAYGVMPALCCLAFLLGTVACRCCLRRWSVPKVVRLGASLSLLGAASQLLLWKFGIRGVWSLALPQCVYMLGHGFHNPCGQAGAVAPFPAQAGQAAAASGFVLTGIGFLIGQMVTGSARPASETLVVAMACIATALGVVALVAVPLAFRRAVSDLQ
jgi:DHA1 family bicyclomycin/chloramphenicol resistance-like MFS transporter